MSEATQGLTMPLIHMNGSGAKGLYDQHEVVWKALEAAREALRKAAPNLRDYYPYDDGVDAHKRAFAEHRNRLGLLDRLQEEIQAIMEHCSDHV